MLLQGGSTGALPSNKERWTPAGAKQDLVILIHLNSGSSAPCHQPLNFPAQHRPPMLAWDRCYAKGCTFCCLEVSKNITRCFNRSDVLAGAGFVFFLDASGWGGASSGFLFACNELGFQCVWWWVKSINSLGDGYLDTFLSQQKCQKFSCAVMCKQSGLHRIPVFPQRTSCGSDTVRAV